jgi:hypothetical protein
MNTSTTNNTTPISNLQSPTSRHDTQFASTLPPVTVLINGRDEPRVVFDVGPLFEGKLCILFYTFIPSASFLPLT